MGNEGRKFRRGQARQEEAGSQKNPSIADSLPPDVGAGGPAGVDLKGLVTRLGLPLIALWVVFGMVAAYVDSTTWRTVLIAVPAIATGLAIGVLVWARRQSQKAQGVASILREMQATGDRGAALEKLDSSFKKTDPAAIFAKAQLELQEDPRKALATLELINLNKVLGPIADEARSQRAMIHLMLGEVGPARQLVDNIDIKRHQDPKSRAMIASVMSEAWARSGNAKKASETLDLFDPDDDLYAQIRPQLWRARAYCGAYQNDLKGMRRALKKLLEQDVRLLGGFMIKKTHPLLQKEAKKMLEQSGQVPRKMMVQRRQ
ncbi:MAG: hypothetical protein SFV15_06555 [Polyangiaceae bacterium]|nr:hypothetical protein [Polyangiaceae bacterium]